MGERGLERRRDASRAFSSSGAEHCLTSSSKNKNRVRESRPRMTLVDISPSTTSITIGVLEKCDTYQIYTTASVKK